MNSAILQTARPLEKGDFEVVSGIGIAAGEYMDKNSDLGAPAIISTDFFMKVGFGANMDGGLRMAYSAFTHIDLDLKYNFYRTQNEKFYASSGLQFSTGFYYNLDDADRTLYVPLYLSFGDHDDFTFYMCQRIGAWVDGTKFWKKYRAGSGWSTDKESTFVGISGGLGFQFVNDRKFGFELSYLYGKDYSVYRYLNHVTNDPNDFEIVYRTTELASIQFKFYWVLRPEAMLGGARRLNTL